MTSKMTREQKIARGAFLRKTRHWRLLNGGREVKPRLTPAGV